RLIGGLELVRGPGVRLSLPRLVHFGLGGVDVLLRCLGTGDRGDEKQRNGGDDVQASVHSVDLPPRVVDRLGCETDGRFNGSLLPRAGIPAPLLRLPSRTRKAEDTRNRTSRVVSRESARPPCGWSGPRP